MNRRLVKSHNKIIAGVCAGWAEYLGIDPTVVRLIYILLTLGTIGFPGVIFYIICIIIMPNE